MSGRTPRQPREAAGSPPVPEGRPQIVEADWTWTGEGFAAGVRLHIGADGRIAALSAGEGGDTGGAGGDDGYDEAGAGGRPAPAGVLRLHRQALLPGFVSAHSHAFQRDLRGRGERFPAGSGSFWSWREAMYDLAAGLDAERFERLCEQTFRELRAAGVTTVGEFHYFHHARPARSAATAGDYVFDARLLRAAARAGIRIALLNTYYRTGGVAQPLAGAQRRFASPSPARFWEHMDRLAGHLAGPSQTLGAAIHSVRAAPPEDVAAIHGEARRRGMAVHMHVEEQRQEIADCLAHYGRRPMQQILAAVPDATGFTAVHCTHTTREDMERFVAAGGTACICPLTEANLGDGLPDLGHALRLGGPLCLGTDSNARISLLEEMRWLEYGQRLRGESRGVLRDGEGEVARSLLRAATAGGAAALGLPCGELAPGRWADLAAIDLDHPALAGWDPATLLESLVFGAGNEVITATAVGGVWQRHRQAEPAGPMD
jgi:formiminoglutamate deiminase